MKKHHHLGEYCWGHFFQSSNKQIEEKNRDFFILQRSLAMQVHSFEPSFLGKPYGKPLNGWSVQTGTFHSYPTFATFASPEKANRTITNHSSNPDSGSCTWICFFGDFLRIGFDGIHHHEANHHLGKYFGNSFPSIKQANLRLYTLRGSIGLVRLPEQ